MSDLSTRPATFARPNGARAALAFSPAEYARRMASLRAIMAEADVPAVLLTSMHNIAYYSGFLYCGFGRNFGREIFSCVDNYRDTDTAVVQGKCHLIGRIIVGRYHHYAGGFHGITIHILHRCVGQHDARSIIIFKNQRLLDGTGGQ